VREKQETEDSMPRWIEITFRGTADVHRVRNLAEQLSWRLAQEDLGFLSGDDADAATDKMRITRVRAKRLRRALAFIKDVIVEHGFSGDAVIVAGSEDEAV
jgi:hypothetical protein